VSDRERHAGGGHRVEHAGGTRIDTAEVYAPITMNPRARSRLARETVRRFRLTARSR
jgi:hypothetical protein